LDCLSNFAYEFIILELYQLRVDEGVLDVLVSEQSHDIEDVFGLMVLHGGFPMSEDVESYLQNSWISKLVRSFRSLPCEACPVSMKRVAAKYVAAFLVV
jgi:hypothetical protein